MRQIHPSIFAAAFLGLLLGYTSCSNPSTNQPSTPTEVSEPSTPTTPTTPEKSADVEFNDEPTEDAGLIMKVEDFVLPDDYTLFESAQGDLNGDGMEDFVLMVKATDPEMWLENQFGDTVDRNRRGLMIHLSATEGYHLAVQNLDCFASENEDGGVYFPPELSLDIAKGKLYVHYGHGRYGFWKYTFRYEAEGFALIGYDHSENYGPLVRQEVSINFLTGKMLIRQDVNPDSMEPGDEVFEETWEDLADNSVLRLSEVEGFGELHW